MADDSSETTRFANPPELALPPGYSNVVDVRAGRVVYIAGQVATDGQGTVVRMRRRLASRMAA